MSIERRFPMMALHDVSQMREQSFVGGDDRWKRLGLREVIPSSGKSDYFEHSGAQLLCVERCSDRTPLAARFANFGLRWTLRLRGQNWGQRMNELRKTRKVDKEVARANFLESKSTRSSGFRLSYS
jgi:hypothetical protein